VWRDCAAINTELERDGDANSKRFHKGGDSHNIDEILGDQGLFAMLLHFSDLVCILFGDRKSAITKLSSLLFSVQLGQRQTRMSEMTIKRDEKMKEGKTITSTSAKLLEMSSSSLHSY